MCKRASSFATAPCLVGLSVLKSKPQRSGESRTSVSELHFGFEGAELFRVTRLGLAAHFLASPLNGTADSLGTEDHCDVWIGSCPDWTDVSLLLLLILLLGLM